MIGNVISWRRVCRRPSSTYLPWFDRRPRTYRPYCPSSPLSPILRCDPGAFLELTSSCPLPTLHCMLHTVLPSFVSRSQSGGTADTSADGGRSSRETRGASAVRALCRKAGILSANQKQDPVRFRDVLSASGLRNLGRLGREAEITLAEAFFEAFHQA